MLFIVLIFVVIVNVLMMFDVIDVGDFLLYYLYESFQLVFELLQQVVKDLSVVVIKQMIYCIGIDLLLMDVLMEVVCNGKEVIVVVELFVCFDEEININWVLQFEVVGVYVVYGVVGYKCYVKMMLIVWCVVQVGKVLLCCYVYFGIGNYYLCIVCFYIDFGLMMVDQKICEDVYYVFQ